MNTVSSGQGRANVTKDDYSELYTIEGPDISELKDVGITISTPLEELANVGKIGTEMPMQTHLEELTRELSTVKTPYSELLKEDVAPQVKELEDALESLEITGTTDASAAVTQGRWAAIMAWARTNSSQLSYSKIFYSCVLLAGVCIAAHFGGLSIWGFLALLKVSGLTTTVPAALLPVGIGAAKNLGTKVGIDQLFALAKRNKTVNRSLSRKVPKGYLLNVLHSLGITHSDALTYQELYSAVGLHLISNSATIASGDVSGYLITVAKGAATSTVKSKLQAYGWLPGGQKQAQSHATAQVQESRPPNVQAVDNALNMQHPMTGVRVEQPQVQTIDPDLIDTIDMSNNAVTPAGIYTASPATAVTGAAIASGLIIAAFSGKVSHDDSQAAAKAIIGTLLSSAASTKVMTEVEKRYLTSARAMANPLGALHSFVDGISASKIKDMRSGALDIRLKKLGYTASQLKGLSSSRKRKILLEDFEKKVQRLQSMLLRAIVSASVSALTTAIIEKGSMYIYQRGGAPTVGPEKEAADKNRREEKRKKDLERAGERIKARARRGLHRSKSREAQQDTIVVRPSGVAHAIPHASQLMNKQLEEATDFTMVPLGYKIGEQAIKSLGSFIPYYGQAQAAIDITNNMLEGVWAVNRVAVIANILQGKEVAPENIMAHTKIPDPLEVAAAKAREALGAEFNVKTEVLRLLKDSVIEGWTKEQLGARLTALVAGGRAGVAAYDATESTIAAVADSLASILEGVPGLFDWS